jgi:hypothetical protein
VVTTQSTTRYESMFFFFFFFFLDVTKTTCKPVLSLKVVVRVGCKKIAVCKSLKILTSFIPAYTLKRSNDS